jgi:hypothetical protein
MHKRRKLLGKLKKMYIKILRYCAYSHYAKGYDIEMKAARLELELEDERWKS